MIALRISARLFAGVLVLGSLLRVAVTRPWIGLSNSDVPPAFHWTALLSFVPALILVWSFAAVLLLLASIDERLEGLQFRRVV